MNGANAANMDAELERRINAARLAGAMRGYTQAEFKNYLLDLGLNRYEKAILPVETEGEYQSDGQAQSAKIIPFPGVSLPEPDSFQNELDNFLKDIGYIEG